MLLPVKSCGANRLLLCAGIVFVTASGALLVYYVLDTAGAASLTDRALQSLLLVSGAYGAWLAIAARTNLASARRDGRATSTHAAAATM